MLCTIYLIDIGTFVGDTIPHPPYDPLDDKEMVDVVEGESPPRVQILVGIWRRVDIRFRMELGDRLCRLLVDEEVYLVMIKGI